MNKLLIWLVVWLSTICIVSAKTLDAVADTITPDYNQAVDLCLFHRYDEAERVLKQIVRHPAHPNRDAAQFLLTEEVYLWRGLYQQYILFADSIGQQPPNYTFAKLIAERPATQILLLGDSTAMAFRLKKKGHIVVEILVSGKPRKFIVDTGAQRTFVSTKLASELQLPQLLNESARNSLGQTLPASVSILDSLRLGDLYLTNLPVLIQSLWGFGVDGALGWDVLKYLCFTIDYRTKILAFRKPAVDTTLTKNLLGGSRPLMAFHSQNGDQLNLFFDSGSNDNVSFSPNGATKIGSYQSGRRFGGQLGFGGKMRFGMEKTVKRTKVTIDERVFNLKKAVVNRSNEGIGGVLIDGIVGSGQFRNGRLIIDYLNHHFEYVE